MPRLYRYEALTFLFYTEVFNQYDVDSCEFFFQDK